MCCLHEHSKNGFKGCAECMIKVFEDMDIDWEADDVCKQLEGDADFCGDIVACFSGDDPYVPMNLARTKLRNMKRVQVIHALDFVRSGTLVLT